MSEKIKFTAEELKVVQEYRDKERATSFSQTTWPFIFFMLPSFFLFCVFLGDGLMVTGVIAYIGLLVPYALVAIVMRGRSLVLHNIISKYEASAGIE